MDVCQKVRLSEIITQYTEAEKIVDTKNEHYITLALYGNGARERVIKDGKYPVPFLGYRVSTGQFIYSRIDARNGAYGIIDSSLNGFIVSKDFPVYDIDTKRVLPQFLLRSVLGKSFTEQVKHSSFGATNRMRIKENVFENYLISLPPLERQKQIVDRLDSTHQIIRDRKQELTLLDQLVKARFVEMFGDPEENPFGWEKLPLSGIILNANNGMARRGNDEKGNIVMRLVELQDGYIDYSNPNRILLRDNEKKRYLLKDKDFLFARVNGNPDNVGRCAVFHDIGEDVYHNDHIIRVHFNEELLNGAFASALLNSDYGKRQLKNQIKTSAGQYTVSQDGIGAIITILPPIKEQNQFQKFVSQINKSKAAVQKALDEAQLLFDSLMQQYFG